MEVLVMDFINRIMDSNIILTYCLFFISCLLQLIFPPFPSDVILIFQGYVTSVAKAFSFLPIMVNAICGTMLGSYIVFKFGYVNGSKVFEFRFIKRYIDEKHRKRAERLFEKYGSFAVFLSKFVPGVNALLILLAGVFRLRTSSVLLPVFFSVIIHHSLVLLLGHYLGSNITYVKKLISTYNWIVIALIIAVVLLYLGYKGFIKYWRSWIKATKSE